MPHARHRPSGTFQPQWDPIAWTGVLNESERLPRPWPHLSPDWPCHLCHRADRLLTDLLPANLVRPAAPDDASASARAGPDAVARALPRPVDIDFRQPKEPPPATGLRGRRSGRGGDLHDVHDCYRGRAPRWQ